MTSTRYEYEYKKAIDGDSHPRSRLGARYTLDCLLGLPLGADLPQPSDRNVSMLQGSDLVRATRPFAREQRARSWWHLWSTLAVLGSLLTATALPLAWWARLGAGFLTALLLCRMFILYHDHQHGSILRKSRLADWLMAAYGILMLNPPSTWNESHNHHHKHNAKIRAASIGSFPVMTVEAYARATRAQRLGYAISRHPLTIAFGWFTVFFYAMTLKSLMHDPRRHYDCGVAIALHLAVWTVLAIFMPSIMLFSFIIPCSIASALGAYLFYAQHSYPTVDLRDQSEWDYSYAALHSSSFMDIGPVMHWFTGNIGYHHVHHMNARIPFYRLPEAMAALPELQAPGRTSLRIGAIIACFRLKLWDEQQRRMVAFNGR